METCLCNLSLITLIANSDCWLCYVCVRLPVLPSARNNWIPTRQIFLKFLNSNYTKICGENTSLVENRTEISNALCEYAPTL
jgi:hypothetical protein